MNFMCPVVYSYFLSISPSIYPCQLILNLLYLVCLFYLEIMPILWRLDESLELSELNKIKGIVKFELRLLAIEIWGPSNFGSFQVFGELLTLFLIKKTVLGLISICAYFLRLKRGKFANWSKTIFDDIKLSRAQFWCTHPECCVMVLDHMQMGNFDP